MSSVTEPTNDLSERSTTGQAWDRSRLKRGRASQGETGGNSTAVKTIIEARNIKKDYKKGKVVVPVLKGVNLKINEGEFCAIVGKSGSGKSTLLHLLGTLDAPCEGEIHFHGERIDNISARRRDRLRNLKFGLIFQFYHLLPELTTLENVLMPRMISDGIFRYWANKKRHVERAKHLLEIVGLSHRLTHRPSELSGGEMQRTAIARALIAKPELLLADEPTGNLDAVNGGEILAILQKLREEENLTIVIVTHDDSIAAKADRVISLVNGKFVDG